MKCNFCYLMIVHPGLLVLLELVSRPVAAHSSDPHLFENRDGYIIGNYLHASEQDIRDFFWTGSGDGPAVNPFDRFPISEDAIIKTATVVATVYIDRNNGGDGVGDDLCIFDCPPDGSDGVDQTIDNVTPTDRRFWLMTVVGGLFGKKDYPELEGKLARLYRVAFSRQQALHLGINNNTLHMQPSYKMLGQRRAKRQVSSNEGAARSKMSESSRMGTVASSGTRKHFAGANVVVNEQVYTYEHILRKRRKKVHKRDTEEGSIIGDDEDSQRVMVVSERGLAESDQNEPMQQMQRAPDSRTTGPDVGVDGGTTPLTRNYDKDSSYSNKRRVRILIHNTTHLREGDNDEDSMAADSPRSNKLLNQTEIIYSVFVGGQPVLATTAAEDMKLMSQEEMERVMETMVYLKADRTYLTSTPSQSYLKEPQATPLIPSTYNGNSNVIALIGQNPVLFVVSCMAAALFLLLLIVIFLVARGKRKHITELKKLESTQALVMPGSTGDELNTVKSESGSSQHSPFTRDPSALSVIGSVPAYKPSPTIHFPLPPMSRPTSSSSYSSDSSVYYPKRKLKHHTQELLDERAVTLTNKLQKQFGTLVATENVYASVQKPKKDQPHKRRRKYLGENRVGSIDGAAAHALGSPATTSTGNSASGSSEQSYDTRPVKLTPPFEHNETFNTDVIMRHYLKKKTGHYNAGFTLDEHGSADAARRGKIKCLEQCGRTSVDTGSIGSYLSMASVKSFPRCFVPEPLSRVLEPVTMTHLDQSEAGDGGKSTAPGTASTSQYNTDTELQLSRSQSDGADPGVIGPVVWQMHKREMEEITSPLRDPVITRNRFEGLLEGAIQLYSEPPDKDEANKNSITLPGVIRSTGEHRGKSAAVVRETTSRVSSATVRPVTAAGQAHCKREGSRPPSPERGAWSSGTHSPLVRPMSAGPFHTPLERQLDITRVVAPRTVLQSTELSTAPLLQNLMQELKRFRN
ncbi:uncharacterized protein LOC131696162 isoform X1 [Topomyia yanbarensis]|uniref:uncharacterized protein LOC131696060 isoform X2 n=1 Tax=Topomyia yanbarensis TaxID=2498891 RepID=UPI00273AE431|nr:uncharacterized protein LOC131696060 isoform X2 [Topomyia yanbarensis]XP_058840686.1 uncharacterized protein LOC131696162 isoform X1 [Topomyia yanbarensis]